MIATAKIHHQRRGYGVIESLSYIGFTSPKADEWQAVCPLAAVEIERDLATPAHQYAVIESALRHADGLTASAQRATISSSRSLITFNGRYLSRCAVS